MAGAVPLDDLPDSLRGNIVPADDLPVASTTPKKKSWAERMFPELAQPTARLDPLTAQNQGNADAGAALINLGMDSTVNLPGQFAGFLGKVAGQVGRNFNPAIDPAAWRQAVTQRTTIPTTQRGQEVMAEAVAPAAAAWERNIAPTLERYPALGAAAETAGTALEGAGWALGIKAAMPRVASASNNIVTAFSKGGALRPQRLTAEQVLAQQAGNAGSQGAAAAVPQIQNANPAIRRAVEQAGNKGGKVNQAALGRQMQADSLPVKITLTEGQATGDVTKLSHERNLRGTTPKLADHFNQQNRQLVDNLQVIRDKVGPDVFTTNAVEHADEIIRSYKRLDSELSADIRGKYKALADANGGSLPIESSAFLKQASDSLRRENKSAYLPPEIKRTLANIQKSAKVDIAQNPMMNQTTVTKTGGMTFGQFENLRTDLAAASRKAERAGDGNAKAAIALVRDALENMTLPPGAENLKPLADAARTAARNRFQMIEADPAYKAAVNKTVRPDLYVRRFIINGDRDKVSLMRQNLKDDAIAGQTISVAALDHLRNGARVSPDWNGNFSQAGFAKTLQQLDPKRQTLFAPDISETLDNLRDVASHIQSQPAGSFVNNSNTFVAGVAKYGAGAAEGVANVAAGGIPVGTWTKQSIEKLVGGRRVDKMIAPGAGIAVKK